MISNQILQNTIEGLKAITRIDHRQTVRFCKGFSFSRFLMSISWSLLFWQEEIVMMSI